MVPRARIKILIADDHDPSRKSLDRLLRREGFDTVLARDGDEASERIGEGVDLAILDLKMPGRSGLDEKKRDAIAISSLAARSRRNNHSVGTHCIENLDLLAR